MSTEAESDDVPTMQCRNCRTEVPAGAFCGLCGAHLTPEPGGGSQWLRVGNFGAAPDENLLRPSIASALFPHLPQRSRTPFRIGLVLVLIGLVGFSLVRLPAALITVAALGLPLLFVLYLAESGIYRDVSGRSLVITGVIGAALGSGWILLTGEVVARSYGVPVAASLAMHHLFREGFVIPAAGAILMLVPTVAARLLRPTSREALDGFVIGALGALTFAGAATLTRLAPQFATGLLAHGRPVTGLLVEAGLCGVTIPLTAAVACGLFGMGLWFKGQTDNRYGHPGRVRAMLFLFAGLVLLIHVGVGATGIIGLPQLLMLGIDLLMALVALLVLRFGLQLALLHEAHDPIQELEPLLCVHCAQVVPDMAFCPACGVATRASSRSSRQERRESRPVRLVAAEGS